MESLFDYTDYRQYIKEYYEHHKQASGLSYRTLSKRAGFTSPVYIKQVIDGVHNLTNTSITKLGNAMELNKAEKKYFRRMVYFNQAKHIDEKLSYLDEMRLCRSELKIDTLDDDQFEYFSHWYIPVIKELVRFFDFNGDYSILANKLSPPIKPEEAKSTVELLKRLNLIAEENGTFKSTKKYITTKGFSEGTFIIKQMQQKLAFLAGDAVMTVPKELRDISGLSVAISKKTQSKISAELKRCRERIMQIVDEDTSPEEVYRINLHLFPLSDPSMDN